VRARHSSPNTDGLDIDSSRHVLVEGCTFDVGDDCVALKSGKNAQGRAVGRPTQDVVIRDCTMFAGHGGIVVGSEMSGGVRRVRGEDCRFVGTNIGIRLKTCRGRGGVVEDLLFRDLHMTNIRGAAVSINSYDATRPTKTVPPVTEETPTIRRVRMEHLVCHGAADAIALRGLPEMPLQDIVIEDSDFGAKRGASCHDVRGVTLRNVELCVPDVAALNHEKVEASTLDRVRIEKLVEVRN